jgi:hypothetical protein
MSIDMYVRKAKINNSDYNNIANLPNKDQIEIFRTRSLNKYKELNRMQSNKKYFQQAHETRSKKQNIEELKIIQEAENKLENRMKLRSAKTFPRKRSIIVQCMLKII